VDSQKTRAATVDTAQPTQAEPSQRLYNQYLSDIAVLIYALLKARLAEKQKDRKQRLKKTT